MFKQTGNSYFLWHRLHSLAGFGLMLFLIVHLFTNSQAALFIGDDGAAFIRSVNSIHEIPYLPIVEVLVLAAPFLIHAIWGVYYIKKARYNSFGNTGHTPYLPQYPRNHAYTWQRITSWILLFGIIAHVIHMRFLEYPTQVTRNHVTSYLVQVTEDAGLHNVADRLGVTLYSQKNIEDITTPMPPHSTLNPLQEQSFNQETLWAKTLKNFAIDQNELVAAAPDFGTAELLIVRNAFKGPLLAVLYTILVLTATFHAFNGLWTFMISWGVTLTERAQAFMQKISFVLMVIVSLFGLSAIWLTYWVNLKS